MVPRPLATLGRPLGVLTLLVVVACSRSGQSSPPVAAPAPDEPALMVHLRETVASKPEAALSLADDGERRFGESPAAEERRALAISALIHLQRMGSARSRAYDFLRRYPDGPYTPNVAAMTGVHLTPTRPQGDAR